MPRNRAAANPAASDRALAPVPPAGWMTPSANLLPVVPTQSEAETIRNAAGGWPFVWLCTVMRWDRAPDGRSVTVDLVDPGNAAATGKPTAQLTLPRREGDAINPAAGDVALVALPLRDPRTRAALAAMQAAWEEDSD